MNHEPSPAFSLFSDDLPQTTMTDSDTTMTLEETQELYDLLIGRSTPDGFHLGKPPKLSPKKAFTVIYMLQERYHVIPDYFEQCCECKQIFNTEAEGTYSEKAGKHWCGSCCYLAPDESENSR